MFSSSDEDGVEDEESESVNRMYFQYESDVREIHAHGKQGWKGFEPV